MIDLRLLMTHGISPLNFSRKSHVDTLRYALEKKNKKKNIYRGPVLSEVGLLPNFNFFIGHLTSICLFSLV